MVWLLRIGGWWKLGFPLTVTGGEFPFFYGEGPFFSIGLYSTWLKNRFFVGKSFWYSKMVYLQPIDSCQNGSESMPPRKAIDWTNDDDLIRRLEHDRVHWPWRISRGFLKANRNSNWDIFGFIMIYHPKLDWLMAPKMDLIRPWWFISPRFWHHGDLEDVSLQCYYRCIFSWDAFRRFGSERVSGVEHNLKETRAGGQATKSDGWTCGWLMGDKITNHQILICICLA